MPLTPRQQRLANSCDLCHLLALLFSDPPGATFFTTAAAKLRSGEWT